MPAEYKVKLGPAAQAGLASFDRSTQVATVKQLDKLKRAPELGQPLGHKMGLNLTGYRKLRAGRVRVIYQIKERERIVDVLAIGPREDARVYRIAEAEARKCLRRIG